MNRLKVIRIDQYSIEFENGIVLSSYHEESCCENHYLSFSDLTLEDFEGLEFDLSNDNFFNRIEGYGIELVPISGYTVKVPGYGSNNGYYSDNLSLILENLEGLDSGNSKTFDITECQEVSG